MKFAFSIIILLSSSFLYADNISRKPKILVISSEGGCGHTAAVECLQSVLGSGYEFKVMHPLGKDSYGWLSYCDRMYNFALHHQLNRSLNFLFDHIQPLCAEINTENVKQLIASYIDRYKPDMVITVAPIINTSIGLAAQEKDLPYLIITTDHDLKQWVYGMEKLQYDNFKVTIGGAFDTSMGTLLSKGVAQSAIHVTGLPIKSDFFEKKNINALKQQYNIEENKKVILLMMGGIGNKKIINYAKHLLCIKNAGFHVLACIGKSEILKSELSSLPIDPSNSLSIIPFTSRVSDLIAISDLMITKPGPGAMTEAAALHVPILVDHTSPCLRWEKGNLDYIRKHQIGEEIIDLNQLPDLLKKYLYDELIRSQIQARYSQIPQNQFKMKIQEIVDEMLSNSDCSKNGI